MLTESEVSFTAQGEVRGNLIRGKKVIARPRLNPLHARSFALSPRPSLINMSAPLAIAFIGTGVMGRSMAGHLQKAGHALHVYNRTKEKAQALIGARKRTDTNSRACFGRAQQYIRLPAGQIAWD